MVSRRQAVFARGVLEVPLAGFAQRQGTSSVVKGNSLVRSKRAEGRLVRETHSESIVIDFEREREREDERGRSFLSRLL